MGGWVGEGERERERERDPNVINQCIWEHLLLDVVLACALHQPSVEVRG